MKLYSEKASKFDIFFRTWKKNRFYICSTWKMKKNLSYLSKNFEDFHEKISSGIVFLFLESELSNISDYFSHSKIAFSRKI